MSTSSNLRFDYLVGAQTQKHLTVNNALARLDATAQWCIQASGGVDGTISLNPNGADLDLWLNGAAETISPKLGWRAYFLQEGCEKIFDGTIWQAMKKPIVDCTQFDLNLASAQVATIPEKSIVFGCTARVTEAITGTNVTSWRLGVPDDTGRYGQGLWLGKNGWAKGLTGTPITYWSATSLSIKGEGGTISAGRATLFLYLMELAVP